MISSLGAASSSSSSSSSPSASVRVEKATSEFLIGPDWTMNIDICDSINSNQWLAKDVVKAVKKRLQHKNPKVQLLALTLLETMVKNCGDNVHFQIAERNILQDMVKIVKKKTDMHVRDKVLVLLDSWQEAFGGPGGKYPQYYWAYEELRRGGVEFPKRTYETAPIFTPPVTQPAARHPQPGYGMPSNSSTRLDEAMAAEAGNLSLSSINSMREVADLLADMLQAATPGNRLAVKDEVIVDLVDQCRSNQKNLMQMLTTTGDEELLGQGLELNDSLQNVLAKHDAIASGSPLPNSVLSAREMHNPSRKPAQVTPPCPTVDAKPCAPLDVKPTTPIVIGHIDEEEDEEDDFAQLARRHLKTSAAAETSEGVVSKGEALEAVKTSNALILRDPPASTKEQDIIDLLSLTLSSTIYPETPKSASAQSKSTTQGHPYADVGYQHHDYVAPWAQPQSQAQFQPLHHPQHHQESSQQQISQQQQPDALHRQPQQVPLNYPPPPWAATPGYFSKPTPQATTKAEQNVVNSFPTMASNNVRPSPTSTTGQKPFIPSYRLFEDLNVFGNGDQRQNSAASGLSGSQSMVGGRK